MAPDSVRGPRPGSRQQLLLGTLLVVLALAGYRAWMQTSPGAAPSSNERGQTARARQNAAPTAAPDVHLGRLEDDHPKPQAERNLFRTKPKAPPPPPSRPPVTTGPTGPPPTPAGPPPPPPITLKFLGFVGAGKERIAVLSDGVGAPVKGREGDTVLGRYKILRIGEESIEMAYLDGRGRTTIRMTGS
jgi:hypothetical protein